MTDQKIIEVLELSFQWLNNIEIQQGLNALLDAMPNNFEGRIAIRKAIEALLEKEKKGK